MVTGRCVDCLRSRRCVRAAVVVRRAPPPPNSGGLDIVVANVSDSWPIPDEEANWRASFDVDMMGTVHLVNAALPHLERSEAASIVTISSPCPCPRGGFRRPPGPYATMKGPADHPFTRRSLTHTSIAAKGIRAKQPVALHKATTYFPWRRLERTSSRTNPRAVRPTCSWD